MHAAFARLFGSGLARRAKRDARLKEAVTARVGGLTARVDTRS